MPQGDKSSYSSKQRRKARHIEEGYERKGVSRKTAEARAWATVNKQDGGAKGGRKASSRAGSKSRGGAGSRSRSGSRSRAGSRR